MIPLLTLLSTKEAKCDQNYFKKDLKTKCAWGEGGGGGAGALGVQEVLDPEELWVT